MNDKNNPVISEDMLLSQEPIAEAAPAPVVIDIPLDPVETEMAAAQLDEADPEIPEFASPAESAETANNEKTPRRKRRRSPRDKWRIFSRCALRVVLVLLITVAMTVSCVFAMFYSIFNGPYPAACEKLTMSLAKSSGTFWIPAFFMGEERFQQIMAGDETLEELEDVSGKVEIDSNGALNSDSDEWANYPDGIRIETYQGSTYTAHIMIVRDPSTVKLITSYPYSGGNAFSASLGGQRITSMMEVHVPEAIAGINAGAFYDDGTSNLIVGSVPQGLVISGGEVVWKSGKAPFEGFVGFNDKNQLVVATKMTEAEAKELNIRDGCEFGPVLIMDGVVNEKAYNNESGFNPRTAIGQRADGAVIMVCIDGRQMGSIGGNFADIIDIMVEYGAVNACNLDGGSSSVMMYRDNYGRYGTAGEVVMINSYSLLQEQPRRMPTFFLVIPNSEG